jgi:hypothetical protein
MLTGTVLGLSGASVAALAQTELTGRVVKDDLTPIVGATVTLTSIRYSVRTDSLGRFRFSGTPGSTMNLSFQAPGYSDDTASVVLPRARSLVRDFVLVPAFALAVESNPSDRALRVRVTTDDGSSIAYANVQVNGSRRYVSDDSGRVTLPFAQSGPISILVRRIGFEPTELRLPAMPDTAVRVRMAMVARTLEAQVVTVRSPFVRLDLSGFYQRVREVERGARVGYFVTPEDLAARNPQNVTDAVEQFPSIRLRPLCEPGPPPHCGVPHNRLMRIEDRNGCPLTVYLDGIRVQPTIRGGGAMDEKINELVQPHSVSGIEVYPRGVSAPSGYPPYNQGSAGCSDGVVLIWTK